MSVKHRATRAAGMLLALPLFVGIAGTTLAQDHLQKYRELDPSRIHTQQANVRSRTVIQEQLDASAPRVEREQDLGRAVDSGLRPFMLGESREPGVSPQIGVTCGGGKQDYLDQPPNQSNGIFSEQSCTICGGGPQVLADQFTTSSDQDLTSFYVWGGYFPANTTPADDFTLIVHTNSGNVPGGVIYSESGVSSARVLTGIVLFGVEEWEYLLTPAASIPLLAGGTYWIELYNDTVATSDDWFWEVGNLNAPGLAGSAFAFQAPGVSWNFDGTNSYALHLCTLDGGLGTKYCTANPNSTGSPADISASGSANSSAGNLTLTSAPVPNQNGVFFHGANQINVPFGNGFLCTGGGTVRGAVVAASGNSSSYTYDNSGPKRDLSAFIGTNRNFQHWTRDPMGGGALHNTSNAISIDILP